MRGRVSIHAPARGATFTPAELLTKELVSIHAPARGATKLTAFSCNRRICFNPRTRTGCDIYNDVNKRMEYVSIHAPARGATYTNAIGFPPLHVSIHAPARGATCFCRIERYGNVGFNPRTRTGCDLMLSTTLSSCITFQSTHPHGVRHPYQSNASGKAKFQSTHPHGVRPEAVKEVAEVLGFNPRTRTGCDVEYLSGGSHQSGFNPRTRTGCDNR